MADAARRFDPMATFAGFRPYFSDGNITIYQCDCRDLVDDIIALDAFVYADPPYGVRERTRRKSAGRSGLAECYDFPEVLGDNEEFDPRPWFGCRRLVLWGATHYPHHLPRSGTWICWDKRAGKLRNDNADFEAAWTNLPGPDRIFSHLWAGMLKASEQGETRTHPTQKPVALARWVFENYANEDDLIVDPYMGSGASLIAAKQLGHSAIGVEMSEEYCAAAVARLKKEPNLFAKMYPSEKECPGCSRRLVVRIGVTFNKKRGTKDGLQPWCRECDARNKYGRENGWKNFRRALAENDPGKEPAWSRGVYESIMGDFKCHWCGNDVTEWGSGYWVDKLSPRRGYDPSNCVPCCWPCNAEKSNKNPEAWHAQIANVLTRYPRGRVPWNELSPKYKHISDRVPCLDEFVLSKRSGQIELF